MRPRPTTIPSRTSRIRTPYGNLFTIIGMGEDGAPLEVYLMLGKAGSSVRPLLEGISRLASLCLRSGVAVEDVIDELKGLKDSGRPLVGEKHIYSIPDALAQELQAVVKEQEKN